MPREGHEAKWRSHDPQSSERSDHAEGNCREDDEGFDRVLELKHKRQEDHEHGYEENDDQVLETFDLILFFAADFQAVADRQVLLEVFQFRARS